MLIKSAPLLYEKGTSKYPIKTKAERLSLSDTSDKALIIFLTMYRVILDGKKLKFKMLLVSGAETMVKIFPKRYCGFL